MKNVVNITVLKGFFLVSLFFNALSLTAINNVINHFQVNDMELTDLKEMLATAQTYKYYNYTDSSWQVLEDAMTVALQLVNNKSDNISVIEASAEALTNAMSGLGKKENLATGATGTASSFHSTGYEAQNALDENFGTRWASSAQ